MRIGRYESSEGNNIGTAVTFFLIGLGAGALTALALAAKTGKQFRRDLKRGYDDAKDTLQDWTEEAKDRVRDVAERGAGLAEDLRDAAREKVEPLRRAVNRGQRHFYHLSSITCHPERSEGSGCLPARAAPTVKARTKIPRFRSG